MTVEELVDAIKSRGGRVPFEVGAFIALEVCEQLLERTARVSSGGVHIGPQGEVRVEAAEARVSEQEAVGSVLDVLAHVLTGASQGVPPMLFELVEQGPARHEGGLRALRDQLEASLVPLNRGATRRVLARLLREAETGAPEVARDDQDPTGVREGEVMEEAPPGRSGSRWPLLWPIAIGALVAALALLAAAALR